VEVATPYQFEKQLVEHLPHLRRWAYALTRNHTAAEDLVQDVAAKALAARHSFDQGTNFKAWTRRIMVNHFISGVRAKREYVNTDQMPGPAIHAEQPGKIDLDHLRREVVRLPADWKAALYHIGIEQRSYEEVAAAYGCAVGTVKSRVHRARVALRARLEGVDQRAA
jgi:RNA polymerase sigma-70 factor (ECF subfamily)